MRLEATLENCIFYIFTMYEFSHSLGQLQTVAPQQAALLFDDLVSDGEQSRRHLDSERSRRLKVDDKL
jgi:hypothetical protein